MGKEINKSTLWKIKTGFAEMIGLHTEYVKFIHGVNQSFNEVPMFIDVTIPPYKTKAMVMGKLARLGHHPHPYSTEETIHLMAYDVAPQLFGDDDAVQNQG